MKKIVLIGLALLLAACTAASKYNQNLTKWQNANIDHYRFQVSIGCFCAFRDEMPLTVEVKNGQVVSMSTANGTSVTPTYQFYGLYVTYATIDDIFTQLKTELDGTADEVKVTYDPTYGFPDTIFIDRIKDAVDDESSIHVSNFEILQ